jgi:hypothetical protein
VTIGNAGPLSGDDARQLLTVAQQTGRAVKVVQTPWWYFGVSAGLYALLPLTQLIGERWWVSFIAVANAVVALNLVAAHRAGVVGTSSSNAGFTATTLLVLVVLAASFLAYRETQQLWAVIAPSGLAAALTLLGGWLYRRNPS